MRMMCINDFLPEDHDARKLVKIIEQIDLSQFDSFCSNDNDGKPAYPIQSLIMLLTYAFLNGVYSTRKIEALCREHIVYRYLCCDHVPDYSTISRFWKRFKEDIEILLSHTIFVGKTSGLITYDHLSGDGCKIKSLGSRSKIYNKESGAKRLESLQRQMKHLMEEAQSTNDKESFNKITSKCEEEKRIKDSLLYLERLQSDILRDKNLEKPLSTRKIYIPLSQKPS